MTARTLITPLALTQDGGLNQGAGVSLAGLVTGGAYLADPSGPFKVLIVVNNTFTSPQNVTVRAGGNGTTASGGTNPGVPFEGATVGDLVVSVTNATTFVIGPLTTDRFTQADGSLSLDFGASITGTIWVYQLPVGIIVP